MLLLAFAAGIVALTLALHSNGTLDRLELDTIDRRFAERGPRQAPKSVVIVAIDDVSFDDFGRRLGEWPRRYHAEVLRRLARLDPLAIIYDVQFTERSDDSDGDYALYEAAGVARPVIFATTEVDPHGGTGVFGDTGPDSARNLRHIHARVGQALLPVDEDGTFRRMGYSLNGLTSLGVEAAEVVTGEPVPAPSGRAGREWIDYVGPPGTIDSVSFSRVYDGSVDPDRLRGKIVVIGPTAPTLHDVHPTSAGGGLMSGAEIQANAFETARRHFPLRSASERVDQILIAVMGFLIPLLAIRLAPLVTLPAVVVVSLGYLFLAQRLFDDGWVVAVVAPLTALALTTISSLAVEYLTETQVRRRLLSTLGRYVPKDQAKELVETGRDRPDDVQLTATILFCDLRGFSSFTETLDPTAFMKMVNEYLATMGEVVEDNKGTVVSYQGDGLLAVFGAPMASTDHADRALTAARQMLHVALPDFNRWIASQRNTEEYKNLQDGLRNRRFDMGIGICSGPTTFGVVGFDERLAYAAVGKATNAASRLQTETKKHDQHRLLVADNTVSMLQKGWIGFRQVKNVKFDGFKSKMMVWGLIEDDLSGVEPDRTVQHAP